MRKVIYKGNLYTVEDEAMNFYKLSGDLWVRKSDCNEFKKNKITIERIVLASAISFVIFHVSRILIIEIAKLL